MVGKILINGQIGTFADASGNIVKGVELVDVIEQVNSQPGRESYEVWINSEGGSVEVGEDIGKYIAALPNVSTIANDLCASIATHIHLSVPLANRKIVEGTVYMIHNPLLTNVTGNSDDFKMIAEWLKPTEDAMVKMYMKATGQSKEAITLLMKGETEFTPQQCVSFGFASVVIPKQYKAVAYLSNNQISDTMTGKEILAKIKAIAAGTPNPAEGNPDPNAPQRIAMVTEGRTAVALKVETGDGKTYVTPYDDGILPGDPITTEDGQPLEAGEITLTDGTVLVIGADETGSFVVEVKKPAGGGETDAEMIAKLQTENADLKAQIAEQGTVLTEITEQVEILAKRSTGSTYTPPKSPVAFRPVGAKAVETKDIASEAKERRAQYKPTK